MAKLRNYLSGLMVLLLLSCSSAPTIIEKPYVVLVPAVYDTIYLTQDTVYAPTDSLAYWEGNVEDSLKNVIGWMKVYYNRKIAELKLNPRIDSVIVHDTIPAIPKDNVIQVISGLLPLWGEIILIAVGVVLLAFANKNTTILQVIKGIFK